MPCPDCAQRDGVILALREALDAFVAAWDRCEPRINPVTQMANIHGMPYNASGGATLHDELAAARAVLTNTAPAAAEATKHILEMGLDVIDDALLARLARCRVELLDEVIGWVERRSPFPARRTLRALLNHLEEMKEKEHRCEVDGAIRTLPCLACGKV